MICSGFGPSREVDVKAYSAELVSAPFVSASSSECSEKLFLELALHQPHLKQQLNRF